jgi:outer membrane PBP1 activator LpoA protein
MDEKIAKLQAATDEAELNLQVCADAVKLAETQLAQAKERLRNLPPSEQETLQVNDTELPELLENVVRAKNVYETVLTRVNTNKRYLEALKAKAAGGSG